MSSSRSSRLRDDVSRGRIAPGHRRAHADHRHQSSRRQHHHPPHGPRPAVGVGQGAVLHPAPRRAARVPGRALGRVAVRRQRRHVASPRVAPAPGQQHRRARCPARHHDLRHRRLARNPDLLLAAVGKDGRRPSAVGIWRSINGGASWTRVHQFIQGTAVGQANCISMAPDSPDLVFAAGGFSLARSLDGGVTWSAVALPLTSVRGGVVRGGRRRSTARHATSTRRVARLALLRRGHDLADRSAAARARSAGRRQRTRRAKHQRPSRRPPRAVRDDVRTQCADRQRRRHRLEGRLRHGRRRPVAAAAAHPAELSHRDRQRRRVRGADCGHASPRSCCSWRAIAAPCTWPWASLPRRPTGCASKTQTATSTRTGSPRSRIFTRPSLPGTGLSGRALLVNDGGANISRDGLHTWTNAPGLPTLGIVNAAAIPQKAKGGRDLHGDGRQLRLRQPRRAARPGRRSTTWAATTTAPSATRASPRGPSSSGHATAKATGRRARRGLPLRHERRPRARHLGRHDRGAARFQAPRRSPARFWRRSTIPTTRRPRSRAQRGLECRELLLHPRLPAARAHAATASRRPPMSTSWRFDSPTGSRSWCARPS